MGSQGARLLPLLALSVLLISSHPAWALSCDAFPKPSAAFSISTAQGSPFATCGAQTSPIIVDTFFGNKRTDDGTNENPNGKLSFAYQAWNQDIGEPVREIFFDSPIASPSVALTAFLAPDQGLVNTSLGTFFAFKTGGDIGLFPLFSDPDNLVITQNGTSFQGVTNATDLTQPNTNLLAPGSNDIVEIMFGEGLDLQNQTIANFGRTEAVGAFLSTTNAVTLSIFDGMGSLIFQFSQTPPTLDPYFMGIVLQRRDQPKQEIIAKARFTFWAYGSNALDGWVNTTVVGAAAPQEVPEPGTLVLIGFGLAGLALHARRRRPRT